MKWKRKNLYMTYKIKNFTTLIITLYSPLILKFFNKLASKFFSLARNIPVYFVELRVFNTFRMKGWLNVDNSMQTKIQNSIFVFKPY